MIITQLFLVTGSVIFFLLTSAHLYYTFFTNKLEPRLTETVKAMKSDQMNLTRQTTIWKAWIGFNGSHSLGGIYLGLVNILLALQYPAIICNSVLLLGLNVIISASYLLLAKKYWFSVPYRGAGIATLCYVMAFLLSFI